MICTERPPIYYDYANACNAQNYPNSVKITDNQTFNFFARYFLQRAISTIDMRDNFPLEWDYDYMVYVLFERGYIGILNTEEFQTIPQQCTLSGYNVFYRPNKLIFANQLFKESYTRTINVDCALIKLKPDYGGILDIVYYFSAKCALLSQGIDINIINSKFANIFAVENSTAAASLKTAVDEILSGNVATFVDKSLFNNIDGKIAVQQFANNLGQNYITTDMLADFRTVINEFDSFIGIPNSNTNKKERLIIDEVNANNVETETLLDLIIKTVQSGLNIANELFNLNLSVKKSFSTGDETDEKPDVNSRTV